MKSINETKVPLTDHNANVPPDGKDQVPEPQGRPPKIDVREDKSHLATPAERSQATSTAPEGAGSAWLSNSGPLVSSRQQAIASETSSSAPTVQRKVDHVDLANHVSLQIFSTDQTKNNKNAIIFLHGGPGLSYDDAFDNLTSWSLDHGYTLVAPEIAGSSKPGLVDSSDSFANPPNYVRDLQAVIQHLRQQPDFKGKEFCVVAHSWGGFQLASFLTDKNISPEDKNFIKQVVFMSPNLDSAHTRIFEMSDRIGGPTFETELQSEMTRRHAGSLSDSQGKINFLNNPAMNKELNEAISPFYRLEQMPKEIPCLFVHPTTDKIVPASQSLAAVQRINSSGGDAKIVMTTSGSHGFFKTGNTNDPEVTATCLGAIDRLIKDPDSLTKVTIDKESLENSDPENIEAKIKEKDGSYENHNKLLYEWHGKGETASGTGKFNKIQVLTQMKKQKESHLKMLEGRNLTAHAGYKMTTESLSRINAFLESQ